jgi:hypothetical protein
MKEGRVKLMYMFVTRIMVRAIGEKPWEWASSYRLMGMIEPVLKDQWRSGQLDFSKWQTKPQIVTDLALHMVSPAAPKDPVRALAEGFLQEENPYPRSSPSRDRWDRAYAKAKRRHRDFA